MNHEQQENRSGENHSPIEPKQTPSHVLSSMGDTRSTAAVAHKPSTLSEPRKNILKNKQDTVPPATGQRAKNTLVYPAGSLKQQSMHEKVPSMGAKYSSIERPAPLKEILKNQSSPTKASLSGKKGKTIGFNLPDSNQDSNGSPKREDTGSNGSDQPGAKP